MKCNGKRYRYIQGVLQRFVDYWIYGHSHVNIDKMIGNTRCVSNQLGYDFHSENKDFNPYKYIEL